MHIKFKVWLLFVISVFVFVYMSASYEKPSCLRIVEAVQVSRWLDGYMGPVSYDSGEWFSNGVLIGTSATEDSDVCVVK